ncbi:MAG: DnaJ C-terminal domain-containing protein, partial [Terriglobales bacterium]
ARGGEGARGSGRWAGAPPPGVDFSGFDFSGFDGSGSAPGAGAGRRGGGSSSGSFRDIFSSIFNRQGAPAESPGSDLEYQVTVGFWDAIRGSVLRLSIPRQDRCPQCNGTGTGGRGGSCPECGGKGQVAQTVSGMNFNLRCGACGGSGKAGSACPRCQGQGRVQQTEALEVRLKPGTREGARLRIAGKGNWGSEGSGDLYVIVRVKPHALFQRQADDIHVKVPISITEAALGAKIGVPTIEGKALLNIPAGTQTGQKFRMRERGVGNAQHDGVRGDEYVEVQVMVPKLRDEQSRELLREFARLNPEDAREAVLKQAQAQ